MTIFIISQASGSSGRVWQGASSIPHCVDIGHLVIFSWMMNWSSILVCLEYRTDKFFKKHFLSYKVIIFINIGNETNCIDAEKK